MVWNFFSGFGFDIIMNQNNTVLGETYPDIVNDHLFRLNGNFKFIRFCEFRMKFLVC